MADDLVEPTPPPFNPTPTPPPQTWTTTLQNQSYTLSTDKAKLDLSLFNKAFAQQSVYWTDPMPESTIRSMVSHSLVFGLYTQTTTRLEANRNVHASPRNPPAASERQIGFARLITDYTTIAYLTDVFVLPEFQGRGLGRWVLSCLKGVLDGMQGLRRAVLMVKMGGREVGFYEKELGMSVVGGEGDYAFMEFVPRD